MGLRKTPLVNKEFYHIYNRGNGRQKIFFNYDDYRRFIKLLFVCNSVKQINFRDDIIEKGIEAWDFDRGETLVSIGAWVLMPNHFHIYLTFPEDGLRGESERENNISIFMRKLCTAYSKYINTKYERTGSLFEGRFKSVHVVDDIQAKYLFSYINLNPIKLIQPDWRELGIKEKNKTLKFLEKYKYSSYLDLLGVRRSENIIINILPFPEYFSSGKDFQNEILEWIKSPQKLPRRPSSGNI